MRFPTLKKCFANKRLAQFDRKPSSDVLQGFIVGLTDNFVVLHQMTLLVLLDGYCVIRQKDIRRYRELIDRHWFFARGLRLTGQRRQRPPRLALTDMASREWVGEQRRVMTQGYSKIGGPGFLRFFGRAFALAWPKASSPPRHTPSKFNKFVASRSAVTHCFTAT